MSETEQLAQLEHELTAVLMRYAQEYDIPMYGAIGVLESLKMDLYNELIGDVMDDEAEGEVDP